MNAKTFLATSAFLGLMSGAAAAQSIECGTDYTVRPGDTLSNISVAAYGDRSNFQLIYNANSATIGRNPSIIEVGDRFFIPCVDAPVVPSSANAENIRTEETVELVEPVEDRVITFVTGTDWAPFQNQDQEQGGMITEVVNVAMSKVRAPEGYKIDFINDYSAHLQPLLSDLHYDISFAWFRPNCDKIELLGEGSKFRCNNLDWSEPLYEQVIGFYTRADAAKPLTHTDMFGSTVCRPAGYATFMMEEHGLVPPVITLERPTSPMDCFEGLVDGTYDMVVQAVDVADDAISKIEGARDVVYRNDVLDTVATMNAVVSKNNPNKEVYMALLNEGINELKDSGEWFEIVRRHLAEHRANQ
ncbi:MAG: transporter substrate-binding domain-containing protein [Pseudomonadota bacterium]